MNAVKELLPTYFSLSSSREMNENVRSPSVQPHVPIKEPDFSESQDQASVKVKFNLCFLDNKRLSRTSL